MLQCRRKELRWRLRSSNTRGLFLSSFHSSQTEEHFPQPSSHDSSHDSLKQQLSKRPGLNFIILFLLSHKWRCDHNVRKCFLISKSSPLPLACGEGRVGEVAQGRGGHSRGGRGGRDKENLLLAFASRFRELIYSSKLVEKLWYVVTLLAALSLSLEKL